MFRKYQITLGSWFQTALERQGNVPDNEIHFSTDVFVEFVFELFALLGVKENRDHSAIRKTISKIENT